MTNGFLPKKIIFILGSILMIFFIVFIVYLFTSNKNGNSHVIISPPTPTSIILDTSTPTPLVAANWPTYTNSQLHMQMKTPVTWQVQQSLSQQSGSYAMIFSPSATEKLNEIGPVGDSYTIFIGYVDTTDTFSSLEKYSNWGKNSIQLVSYTVLQGRKTLIVKSISPQSPPPNHFGQWCTTCSEEYVYIDMGNNTLLPIRAFWHNESPNFEDTFHQVLQTITFTNS